MRFGIGMSVMLSVVACAVSALGGDVLWESDLSKLQKADTPDKGWVLKDLSDEVSGEGVRLRETGEGTEGTMTREIKLDPAAKFIQVRAGVAEQAENTFYMSSGGERRRIYTGWNTFPVSPADVKDGKLRITILQTGAQGSQPGGWADLEFVRVVSRPLDGLEISLADNKRGDNTAKVGDSVVFKYCPSSAIVEKEIEADCFVLPDMSDYRFNEGGRVILSDGGANGDEKAGDGVYSCVVKIDDGAFSFKSGAGRSVFSGVRAGAVNSYGHVFFKMDVETKNAVPQSVFKGANPDIVKYRKMWERFTKGENLALGKKLVFSKQPDYRLTKQGDSDEADLTDGKLSSRKCDTIWFDPAAVGWYMCGAENGVNCLIDLGEPKPVGDVVVRALAGKCQTNLAAPAEFKVFVSKDGSVFYEAASMVKLMQAEKDLSNFKTHYYIDELGKAYTYPFKLEVDAEARYVGVFLKGATGAVFSDEIAVMRGDSAKAGFNDAYKGRAQKFLTSGLLIEPRLKELAISTNINTPNTFQISDMRDKESAAKKTSLVLDVPEGVAMLFPEAKKESLEIGGKKYTRWDLPLKKSPTTSNQTDMMFFSVEKGADVKLPAYAFARSEGVEFERSSFPIRLVEIPEVRPPFKKLHVSLAWMGEKAQMDYPGFFKAWRTMGFNAVSCFPRNWQGGPEKTKKETLDYLDTARKEGFAVVMNESPFHVMEKGHKEGSEIFSQLKSGQKSKHLCPSYDGDFYSKEMERIAQGVALAKPDFVYWDIECWYHGAKEAPACVRCSEARQKSGKSMDEFLKDCGVAKMRGLKAAVVKGVDGGKMPLVHCYDTHPTAPNYDGISDFNRFYPECVDTAANSFYVAGNSQKVHDEMRENYKILKKSRIIPWLSAGCYGEYEPYKLEQMILEALLNGACGITYYWYGDFDTAMDFHYHAKAFAEVAPFEDIIADGSPLPDLDGSNKALAYSAVKKGGEMLLLVGNYKRSADGSAEIRLPLKSVSEVRELRGGEKPVVSGGAMKVNVPKGEIGLYYLRGAE